MKNTVLSAGAAACCALGLSAAPASADSVGGHPCGFSFGGDTFSYVIANCHDYGVNRAALKAVNGRKVQGSCRYIPPRSFVTGTSDYEIVGYTNC